MLGARRDPAHHAALERLRDWTRARFQLPSSAVVMATEVACSLPGCPPRETVVVFWTADGTRHQFKLFKPPEQVAPDDLPYRWLMKSLQAESGDLDCC